MVMPYQMAAGNLPIQPPTPLASAGGFGQNITNWFQQNPALVYALASGLADGKTMNQGLSQAFGNAGQAMAFDKQNKDAEAKKKSLNDWLQSERKNGRVYSPEQISMLQNSPEVASQLFANSLLPTNATTDDLKEYQVAKDQGFTGSFMEFKQAQKGTAITTPADIQEYEYALKQGFHGSYLDFVNKKRGGGTQFSITTPDGQEIDFSQGGPDTSGATQSLGKQTTNKLQEEVPNIEQQVNQLEHIGELYKSEYLTYKGAAKSAWYKFRDKTQGIPGNEIVGGDLTPDEKKYLAGRTAFIQNVESVFNQYRKDITGAAASVAEIERLKQAVINSDSGPTEFEARMKEYAAALKRGLDIKKQILAQGIKLGSTRFNQEFDRRFLSGDGAAAPTDSGVQQPVTIDGYSIQQVD